MKNQDNQKEKPSFEDNLKKILTKMVKNIKASEREHFAQSLDPILREMTDVMDDQEKRNAELKVHNLKNKVALITFNGVLIALMVSSAEKIHYGLAPFLVLFFSFSIGILQLIIFYLMNEFEYIKEKIFGDKCKAVFKFCQRHRDNQSVIIDTQSFIHHEAFSDEKEHSNIPQLLKDFQRTHNATKTFIKVLFFEMLFYVPLVIGFGQVIYSLYVYLPK